MKQHLQRWMHALSRVPHDRIRWTLIALLAIWATAHLLWLPGNATSDKTSYDQMVKRRVWAPAHDPSIVVLDIDEASLDQMKTEFGRWPWPRETLAGALDWLERQGASAVVFDILFADVDTLNPSSDLAFSEAVAASRHSFFPILRLNPINDGLSELRADQLPGFITPLGATPPPTLALVPPVFKSVVDTTRMGFHNIYPDQDGVNRYYTLWEDKQDWRMWSLPARLAQVMGWPMPETPKQLIQFNLRQDSYTRIPFSEVWRLSQSREGTKPDPRFKNAVVVVGATATNLFDIKVTPLEITQPGVFVLANVIDNLKNQRFFTELSIEAHLLITWLALLLMGIASKYLNDEHVKWCVLAVPVLLMLVSFWSLQTEWHYFLDLSTSASHSLLFFSVWSIYKTWRSKELGQLQLLRTQVLETSDVDMHECFAVMQFDKGHWDPHQVMDVLPPHAPRAAVLAVGVMAEQMHQQPGLIYVVIWGHSAKDAQASLQSMPAICPQAPRRFYVDKSKRLAKYPMPMSDTHHFDEVLRNLDIALTYWSDERERNTPTSPTH